MTPKSKRWGFRRRRQPTHIRSRRGCPDRKPSPWPTQFNLKDRLGLDGFLVHAIETFWKNNPLDPRAMSTLNGTIRLLVEARGWIQRTPLQIIQATNVQPAKFDFEKIIQATPIEERPIAIKLLARIEDSLHKG